MALPIADFPLPINDGRHVGTPAQPGQAPARRHEVRTGKAESSIAGTPNRRNAQEPKLTNRAAASLRMNDSSKGKVQAHRRRQESVAKILNQTFGRFAKSNPELWERRAYLMLVGLMYQWLATNEKEVSTDELVSLSKALAEQRRAEAQSRDGGEKETQGVGAGRELPEDFGEAVKLIYGTNFQAPDEAIGNRGSRQ